jgi:succinyl-CoA synthetase beta subunit
LVNIFAGLNRCDDLAMGIKRYLGLQKNNRLTQAFEKRAQTGIC